MTETLGGKIPAGTKFAFLQCSTTICGLTAQLLGPAVKAVGGQLTLINAGGTSSTSQAAASSALALKPAVVIVTGVQLAQFGGKLKELSAAGIKVISVSVTEDVAPYGVTFNYIGLDFNVRAGQLMADWVVARKGQNANVVFYTVPELSFSIPMANAFKSELTKLCKTCQFRTSDISVLTFGTKAPSTVVTDLQAHRDSTVAVFASAEIAAGLPAALKAAGITNLTSIGFAPTPNTLGDIKTGALTAGLGIDLQVAIWTSVDVAARLLLGKDLTAGEKAGDTPEQILEQKDITFDTTRGYAGYPDVAQTYIKLWNG